MSPQCENVLKLLRNGPVTGVEAEAVYRVRHLPRRILDLKQAGVAIKTTVCRDVTGQRYARYELQQGA
jgi:hypothetical protein